MKPYFFCTLAFSITMVSAAAAQALAPDELRRQIDDQNAILEARYEADRVACYQRFAVNDCLRMAQSRRRLAIDELREQEVRLNSQQRRARVDAQLASTAEKSLPEALNQARRDREASQFAHQDRLHRASEKKAAAEASLSAAAPARHDNIPLGDPAISPNEAAENKRRYDEKIEEARRRREDRQDANAQTSDSPAKSLPLPMTLE